MLRSAELSDAQRSSTMSVFRALLNVLVIAVLLLVGYMPERLIFGMALAMLFTCAANISIIQARAQSGFERVASCEAGHMREMRPILCEGATAAEGAKLIMAGDDLAGEDVSAPGDAEHDESQCSPLEHSSEVDKRLPAERRPLRPTPPREHAKCTPPP